MRRQQLEREIWEAIKDKSISEDVRQHLYRSHKSLWNALQGWREANGLERLVTPNMPNPFQVTAVAKAMGRVPAMACTGWQRR